MDIVDLDLSRVGVLKGRGMVGLSKHLCGAATDLALRCLVSTLHAPSGSDGVTMTAPRLCGVAIALCCHHQCSWSHLVGHEFLTDLGFSARDFHVISHMTSWAVCGIRPPHDEKGRRPNDKGSNL